MLSPVMALGGLKMEVMEEPNQEALQLGREFGNRGQCNPTYFTVGNLLKKLIQLRDVDGIPTEKIISNYAFVTAGGCGPCRMGMYATEYRKALRDSGFADFRVMLLTRSGDVQDVLMEGLKLSNKHLLMGFLTIMIGDVFTTMSLRKRPYEAFKGHVDEEMKKARIEVEAGIREGKNWKGLWNARKIIRGIKTKKAGPKPVVHIMGEFWAKTTDGEGNYHLFRFIEEEGGVVSNETIIDWLLHQIWRARWSESQKHESKFMSKAEWKLFAVEQVIRGVFGFFCKFYGVKIPLSDHDALAEDVKPFFDLHVDGGEDHMEVAHHLAIARDGKADMIVSVKPFTCLSSSGVSDGVQGKVSELYPDVEFIAVETNGDGAANFYSRIQMALQKVVHSVQ